MTLFYTSDNATTGFDATTAGATPSGWTSTTGTWVAQASGALSGHVNSFGQTAPATGNGAIYTGGGTVADMEVLYLQTVTVNGTTLVATGPVLRADAANGTNYTITFGFGSNIGYIYFFKETSAGNYTGLQTSQKTLTIANGDTLAARVQIVGSTIQAKLWIAGTAEPTAWDASVTDTSYGTGYAGLYMGGGGLSGTAVPVSDYVVTEFTAGTTTQLTVLSPTPVASGSAMTISGTYAGTAPAGIAYALDGGSYTTISGASIGGGTWSGSITAPAAGFHTISVQQTNNTTITGAAIVQTTSGETISVTTPANQLTNASMTVSGSYTGGPPTALDFEFSGGTWAAASSPTISGGTFSFTTTAPATAGNYTVSVRDHNATTVSGTSGSFTVSTPSLTIAPDNPAIVYSPYTWNVTAGGATSNCAGAYFRTFFTGATCALTFNVSGQPAAGTQIWWRIDDGPWTKATLAATLTLGIPSWMQSNPEVPYHLLEVVVKSTTYTANRWTAPPNTAAVLTGIVLDASASVVAPATAARNILVYGDSITEGFATLGGWSSNDPDNNDILVTWSYLLGKLLGAEVGVVGFGAQGISVGGAGGVPSFPNTWASLYAGAPRSFTPVPDAVVINMGTNDGTTNTVAAMTGILNGLLSACPGSLIVVMRPFDGNQASNLQAAIQACANPALVQYLDTTGFFNTAYGATSDGVHPSGPNDKALIAPAVAAKLKAMLAGRPQFRGGFQRGLMG